MQNAIIASLLVSIICSSSRWKHTWFLFNVKALAFYILKTESLFHSTQEKASSEVFSLYLYPHKVNGLYSQTKNDMF